MSQVIVTEDNVKTRRMNAAGQEHKIKTDSGLEKWKRSDVVGFDPIKTAIGIAVLPIVALWGLILGFISYAFGIVAAMFRMIGKIL